MISIVVPAQNESAEIRRTLLSILASDVDERLEVIVVCNGCDDDTADVARSVGGVVVIETDAPGKARALNLGDDRAVAFPRFYIDADIVVEPGLIAAVAAVLRRGDVLAAAPSFQLDTSVSSRAVRSYLGVWQRLPQVKDGLAGRGVYALSAEGHARLGRFPELVNDDGYVSALFASQRSVVPEVSSTVGAPRTLRELVDRRLRVVAGNQQLRRQAVLPVVTERSSAGWARVALSHPELWAGAVLYAGLGVWIRFLVALRTVRGGALAWGRPGSSGREAPGHSSAVVQVPEGDVGDVSIVVVSFNTAELLVRSLQSIGSSTRRPVQVVVVDNASSDGSAGAARAALPDAVVVELDRNRGFAVGANEGARHATGRWLLLLNPDAVLLAGSLDELLTFAVAHPERGIYGGRVVDDDGRVDRRSCWGLPTPWSLFCFACGLSTWFRGSTLFDPESLGSWERDTIREVGAISGALLLIDRTAWDRLGGFDPAYFMYSEDIDLCDRARELGYRPTIVPSARILHEGGAASTRADKTILVLTGKATYVRRRWVGPARSFGLVMLWGGVALRAVGQRALRRPEAVWPHAWAARRSWMQGYRDPLPVPSPTEGRQ